MIAEEKIYAVNKPVLIDIRIKYLSVVLTLFKDRTVELEEIEALL